MFGADFALHRPRRFACGGTVRRLDESLRRILAEAIDVGPTARVRECARAARERHVVVEVEETGICRIWCRRAFDRRTQGRRSVRCGEREVAGQRDRLAGRGWKPSHYIPMKRALAQERDLSDAVDLVGEYARISRGREGKRGARIGANVRRRRRVTSEHQDRADNCHAEFLEQV